MSIIQDALKKAETELYARKSRLKESRISETAPIPGDSGVAKKPHPPRAYKTYLLIGCSFGAAVLILLAAVKIVIPFFAAPEIIITKSEVTPPPSSAADVKPSIAPLKARPKTPTTLVIPPGYAAEPSEHAPELNTKGIMLSGIMAYGDEWLAVINGEMVRSGEIVRGIKVVSIEKTSVMLEKDGRQALLRLKR